MALSRYVVSPKLSVVNGKCLDSSEGDGIGKGTNTLLEGNLGTQREAGRITACLMTWEAPLCSPEPVPTPRGNM